MGMTGLVSPRSIVALFLAASLAGCSLLRDIGIVFGDGEGAEVAEQSDPAETVAFEQALAAKSAETMSATVAAPPPPPNVLAPAAVEPPRKSPLQAPGAALGAHTAQTRGIGGTLDFGTPNEVRLSLLPRGARESDNAVFYGYMLIGADVSAERKAAIARGLACRVEAVGSAEEAEAIELLALLSVPATAAAEAENVSPDEFLEKYDFPRAARWIEAAGSSVGVSFDEGAAVIFVGSRESRLEEMDARRIARPDGSADPLIADASALSPRYLERWAFELIQSVRKGELKSRQDMQRLMEVHSWIETIGEPFAALMRLAPTAQASGLVAPNCI